MRASHAEQTGGAGISEVMGKFERIGWGPVRNQEHDLGTDLLVQARDERLFARGLIVGAQVKAGPSWFEEEERDSHGNLLGWWYYEAGARHFDDWVAHALPHLLILHDLDRDLSFWVHVTPDQITRTGKGCRILVPTAQTIDRDNVDALLSVAAKQKAAPPVEGTAFSASAGAVPPARRLRHALIAPRLVAPHRNLGFRRPIVPEEAVALIAQGRLADLVEFAQRHPDVPDPREERPSRDWRWLFVRAFWQWAQEEDDGSLRETLASAPDSFSQAANAVVLACALLAHERHDAALDLLDGLIESDELGPVDQAWLLVQRARVRTDIGEITRARRDAAEAQRQLVGDPDDVTASPLAAAAAWQLFSTADIGKGMLDEMLTASDTAVSWWRSQTIAWALQEASMRVFRLWAQDRAHRWGREDSESLNLFAAELNADVTGEHGVWRAVSALGARHRLMTSLDDVPSMADALDAFRRSGDAASLGLAATHLWQLGPVEAVADAVSRIPVPDTWTHTTAKANLELWKAAGDLLTAEAATEAALWCIRVLGGHRDGFVERTRPTFIIELPVADALVNLLFAAEPNAHEEAAQLLAGLERPIPEVLEPSLSGIAGVLDIDKVSEDKLEGLRKFAIQDHGRLGSAILGSLAAHGDERARDQVVDRAAAGDLHALAAVGRITTLHETAAVALIAKFEDLVRATIDEAARSTYTGWEFDGGRGLVLFNTWFPSVARWEPLLALLRDRRVAAEHKRGACEAIVALADRIPAAVHAQLAALIDDLRATEPSDFPGGVDLGGLAKTVAVAVGVIEGPEANKAVAQLAGGTTRERRDVAYLLGRGRCEPMRPILASLATDESVDVSVASAESIGWLAANEPGDAVLAALAEGLSGDRGVLVPRALITGIGRGDPDIFDSLRALVEGLQRHPSATVRLAARRVLHRSDASSHTP